MWVIISRNQCNFCDTAKAMLRSKGYPFTEYNVQTGSSKWILTLIKQAGHTTVPQIFSPSGEYIGGYKELKEHLETSDRKEC
jgi:glutaredoxin